MSEFQIPDLLVKEAHLQFIFPFQINQTGKHSLVNQLLDEKWEFFNLKDKEQERKYYGQERISHERMEKFFLPNIEPILYPNDVHQHKAFRRFSKVHNETAQFASRFLTTTFKILSTDLIVCPYDVGMMNVRIQMPSQMKYSDVLHFMHLFRQLDVSEDMQIRMREKSFSEVKDMIFEEFCPWLNQYLDDSDTSSYFGSLPFFIDERMQVVSCLIFEEQAELDEITLYRAAQIKGYNREGEAYAGALSPDYIKRYIDEHVYDRWADESYYIISDYMFGCLTRATDQSADMVVQRMYGENYYTFLLFFFYRLVLLKLSYEYSQVEVRTEKDAINNLIIRITQFSAHYYQLEVHSRTFGKEIFCQMKNLFELDPLYEYVKQTMDDLNKNHEKLVSRRHGHLLTILTVYTVISGIYGMNLIIEDWEGRIRWEKLPDYSFFEYISLVVAVSGITIGLILGVITFFNWVKEKMFQKRD